MVEDPIKCDACHHSFSFHIEGQLLPCEVRRCSCPAMIMPNEYQTYPQWLRSIWGFCWQEI